MVRVMFLVEAGSGAALGKVGEMQAGLDGRVAVVTGGGRDLGRVLALALADAGADVAVIGRTAVPLDEVTAMVTARGRRAWSHVCDVTDDEAVARTFAAIAAEAGAIDILVNNAAAPRLQRAVAEMTLPSGAPRSRPR